MKNFQLLPIAGSHAEPIKGEPKKFKIYKAGQVVPSNRDLVAAFPNKFVALPDAPMGVNDTIVEVDSDEPTHDPVPLGKDVTEKFETAVNNDLRVFYKAKKYYVVEADAVDDVLNETPLNKSQVPSFIDEYLTL